MQAEKQGNGHHFGDLAKQLGLQLMTGLLPILSARLVAWLEAKVNPPLLPAAAAVHDEKVTTEPVGTDAVLDPPKLPPLTRLP